LENRYIEISPSRINLLRQILGEDLAKKNVIEFGASSGETLRDLHLYFGCTVESFDLFPVDLNFCNSSYFNLDEMNFELIQKNLIQADLILFLDVLEHVKQPKKIIEAILDVNPDLTILMVSPNFASVRMLMAWMKGVLPDCPSGFYDSTHIKWLSESWVKNNFDDKRYAVKTFRVFSNKTHLKILQLFSPRRLCSQFGAVIRSSN
jgi:hypothetical protein